MKANKLLAAFVASTLCATSLKLEPVTANPVAVPACKDIPSCGVDMEVEEVEALVRQFMLYRQRKWLEAMI